MARKNQSICYLKFLDQTEYSIKTDISLIELKELLDIVLMFDNPTIHNVKNIFHVNNIGYEFIKGTKYLKDSKYVGIDYVDMVMCDS